MTTAKELLKRSLEELGAMSKGEACDHDVGICWCGIFRLMDDINAYLKRKGGKDARK